MQGSTFWQGQGKSLVTILAVFLPVEQLQQWPRLHAAFWNALYLVRWYAQEHVILCLVPAFFIAGTIAVAFMYFATLTEVPILQGLLANGMGQGSALALLLAEPALSLPNMLVIRQIIGWRKTIAYVALVVLMATLSGIGYGYFWG